MLSKLAEHDLGDGSSISFLNKALEDKNKNVKLAVIETLTGFAKKGIVDQASLLFLSKLLEDRNERVKFRADRNFYTCWEYTAKFNR